MSHSNDISLDISATAKVEFLSEWLTLSGDFPLSWHAESLWHALSAWAAWKGTQAKKLERLRWRSEKWLARREFPRLSSDGEYLKLPGAWYVVLVVSCLSSMYAARGELSRMPKIVKIGWLEPKIFSEWGENYCIWDCWGILVGW